MIEEQEGYTSEVIFQLRQERGGYKAAVTRKQDKLRDLMLETKNLLAVKDEFMTFKETFVKFRDKHLQYKELITSDAEELKTATEYYEAVLQQFDNFCYEIEEWIETNMPKKEELVTDEINPEDSASQSAQGSSLQSSRIKAKVKKAMLLAQAEALKKKQALKVKQLELQHLEETVDLEGEIATVEAKEKILEEYGSQSGSKKSTKRTREQLNPIRKETQDQSKPNDELLFKPEHDKAITQEQTMDNKVILQSIEHQQRMMQVLQLKVDKLLQEKPSIQNNYSSPQIEQPDILTHNKDSPTVNTSTQPLSQTHVIDTGLSVDDRLIALQQHMLDISQLPKVEVLTFDGNPLKYWAFVRSFQSSVDSTFITDNAKLNRLFQYCSGKALEVIQCCSLMSPDEGYRQAWRLLRSRFGNEYEISKAWTNKVTDRPQIKAYDNRALRQLADDLQSCVLTLEAMGKLCDVDNQTRMVKMVEKLPGYLQGRWRKIVVDTLNRVGNYPNIRDLAMFIERSAQEANDPVYGTSQPVNDKSYKDKTTTFQTSNRGHSSSFNIQASKSSSTSNPGKVGFGTFPSCHMCSETHVLYKCEKFRNMKTDDRREWVKEKKLCFNCFSDKHMSNSCQKDSRCNIGGCTGKHSRYLHMNKSNQQTTPKQLSYSDQTELKVKANGVTAHNATCKSSHTRIALPIVPVKVRANKREPFVTTYALLDSGSTNSFCSQDLIDSLKIEGSEVMLTLTTIGNENKSSTKRASFEITDISEQTVMNLSNVFTIPKLPSLTNNTINEIDLDKWPHLSGINLPTIDGDKVMMILGQDFPAALIPCDVRTGKYNEPYATKTVFGWALNGPLHTTAQEHVISNFIHADDNAMQAQIERFWKLEASETLSDISQQMSLNDKKVLNLWETKTPVINGHYELNIPFKSNNLSIPDNHVIAKSRLDSLQRKLQKDSNLFERYKQEICVLLEKGYAEKVSETDLNSTAGKIWYLPHHAVFNLNKPEKLRVVFDCAAKYLGKSLNDYIFQGPDLTNTLIGVLQRFREKPVAIMADIECMFYQVKVAPEDRDVLRFLWFEDNDIYRDPEVFRMTVHPFGGVWSPSCATFALQRTAIDNLTSFDMEITDTVKDNFYVDDCLKSVETPEDATRLIGQLSSLLQKGGFNITQWVNLRRPVHKLCLLESILD